MWFKEKLLLAKHSFGQYRKKLLDEIASTTYIVKETKTPEGIDGRLVIYGDPKSHVSEQYRILRTNLRSLSPQHAPRSFVVTSAIREEGKTITTSNLSCAFALEPETKVLLIDADLRKPTLHKIFNIPREPGLSDILVDNYDLKHFLSKAVLANLYIIPAGKTCPNPSEVLSSKQLKDLIDQLKQQFHYLFFDCAPIIPVTDAGVLGSQVDGAILIVRAGSTGALDVERALSLLKEAGANPVGAVLTNVVTYVPYYLYRYRYVYVNKYGA